MPVVQGLHRIGEPPAQRGSVNPPVSLGFHKKSVWLGKERHDLRAPILYHLLDRQGIRYSAVKIISPIDLHRAAHNRQRAGGHDRFVVISAQISLGKIPRLPRSRVRSREHQLAGVCHQRVKIQRILPALIGHISVNVLQAKQGTGLDKIPGAQVSGILHIDTVVSAVAVPLARKIGHQIGCPRRHAGTVVKGDALIQEGIQNAGAVGAFHPAALHQKADFLSLFSA